MIAVIDTNVLVSALWKPAGNASFILSQVLNGTIIPCHDYRIIAEYQDVLNRPKFGFSPLLVKMLLDTIIRDGISVIPDPLPDAPVGDEDDMAFYEVAAFCKAPLITGNLKHYPADPLVTSPADFCKQFTRKP